MESEMATEGVEGCKEIKDLVVNTLQLVAQLH